MEKIGNHLSFIIQCQVILYLITLFISPFLVTFSQRAKRASQF